jgi:hypothetical protein
MEGGGEVSDTEYPHCGCADFWPGQGHHPDCPVRHKFETLERENAAMRVRIEELESSLDGKMSAVLENADPALRSAIATIEIDNAAMREAIRVAHDALANVSTTFGRTPAQDAALSKLQPFLP